MTTAFVLSGGGSLGAVQVGMMQALAERGVRPDFLVGSSAGALNAAYVATHGFSTRTLEHLADIWRHLRRRDVFPFAPHHHVLACFGARSSLCASSGLEHLLACHIGDRRFGDMAVPVHVVTTDVLSGEEVVLSGGDLAPAVLASAAIPAVLPAVEINGRVLFDGGVANNTPISQAISRGADRIIVIPAGVPCALPAPPKTALSTAVQALTLLIEQRLVQEVAVRHDDVDLVVLPPLCPLAVSAIDFRHGDALIARSRRSTNAWLANGSDRLPHPERFLSLHSHDLASDVVEAHQGDAA